MRHYSVAGWFGYQFREEGEKPAVSTYCCNHFAVSRDMIRRHPKDVWQHAYHELVEKGQCFEGQGEAHPDEHKWVNAITMEHLSHIVFGGKTQHIKRCCGDECLFKDFYCDFTPQSTSVAGPGSTMLEQ